jgi:putative PIN family toxin of toxin-antitoxin system
MGKVVFDTVVFVRAMLNPHSPCGRLVYRHAETYELILSRPVVEEMLEVLHRPELTRKAPGLGQLDLRRLLDTLATAEIVELGGIPAVCRDPGDDKFLATAHVARAEYLVSEDQDLLSLGNYEGTRIVTCAQLLAIWNRLERE